jgi:hypothetical protein
MGKRLQRHSKWQQHDMSASSAICEAGPVANAVQLTAAFLDALMLRFLQGQLYVFSSVMVFHANLLAVIKVERIQFKVRDAGSRQAVSFGRGFRHQKCMRCGQQHRMREAKSKAAQ